MLSNAMVIPTIPTKDFNRSRQFYEQILGFSVVAEDHSPGIMYQSGEGTMLYLFYQANFSPCDHTVASFIVDNIESEVQELKSKGLQFQEYSIPSMKIKTVNSIASYANMKAAWFKDPENNILAIVELSPSIKNALHKQLAEVSAAV